MRGNRNISFEVGAMYGIIYGSFLLSLTTPQVEVSDPTMVNGNDKSIVYLPVLKCPSMIASGSQMSGLYRNVLSKFN